MADSCKLHLPASARLRQCDSSGIPPMVHVRKRKAMEGEGVMERRKERKRANKKVTTCYDFIALYPAAELQVLILCLS